MTIGAFAVQDQHSRICNLMFGLLKNVYHLAARAVPRSITGSVMNGPSPALGVPPTGGGTSSGGVGLQPFGIGAGAVGVSELFERTGVVVGGLMRLLPSGSKATTGEIMVSCPGASEKEGHGHLDGLRLAKQHPANIKSAFRRLGEDQRSSDGIRWHTAFNQHDVEALARNLAPDRGGLAAHPVDPNAWISFRRKSILPVGLETQDERFA